MSRSRPRREGFALPLAIVVLVLLTMGLAAGFSMASSEISTTASQRAQARAYSYAQMGLEAFLTRRKEKSGATMFCPHCWSVNATHPAGGSGVNPTLDTLPAVRETTTVAFTNGTAIIRATPVYVNTVLGRGKYFITSTGFDNTSDAGGGGGRTVRASRTVGVFVTWSKSTINVVSAWTSLSGISKNGTGVISGTDRGNCGNGDVAGLSVPYDSVNHRADLSVAGHSFTPTGSPPYDTLSTFSAESSKVRMDWASIKNGSAVPADIVIPGGTFPSIAAFAADTNYWPVIHVTNAAPNPAFTYSLPNQGRGMLIVDGDLTISGNNQWYGVIMVGGVLTSNGNNVSEGTTLSGLNYMIGGAYPGPSTSTDNAVANGTKSYVYNSCSVARASSAMARYTMLPNTWMDNLAGY